MAIDKNAVRKGTRWMFCASVVVVDEATAEHVIFRSEKRQTPPEVASLAEFLDCARDPATAEHERLMEGLCTLDHAVLSDAGIGQVLKLLRDAAVYQLERTMPGLPPYVAPVLVSKPAPSAPNLVVAEPVSNAKEVGDYCFEMPPCEPPSERKRRTA